jgi:dienelactone hydrolase
MHRSLPWLALAIAACGGSSAPVPIPAPATRVEFVPQPATAVMASEITQIALRGLTPGSTVDLVAERPLPQPFAPGGQRQLFRAQATFRVDATGTLELASAAPIAGSYRGADLRGLFWSMVATDDAIADGWTDDQVHLVARAGGQELARTTLTLRKAHPDVVVTPAGDLPGAVLARLPGDQRRPAIIALGGSEGGDSFAREMAPRLASYGFAVLGLPYYAPAFGGPPRPELAGLPTAFTDIPVDRLEVARAWLARQPGVDVDHLALYGGSKGAEFALIAATRLPWVTAVVAIVPSDVVWEGWGVMTAAPGTRSSFAWRGAPLPFVPYHDMAAELAHFQTGQPVNLRRVQDQGRAEHPDAAQKARIPVEQFRGALLVAGGGADQVWASGDMATNIARTRSAAGLATTALVFPAAGHLLSGTGWQPTTGVEHAIMQVGGTAEANAHAQADVWRETIAFLTRSLTR